MMSSRNLEMPAALGSPGPCACQIGGFAELPSRASDSAMHHWILMKRNRAVWSLFLWVLSCDSTYRARSERLVDSLRIEWHLIWQLDEGDRQGSGTGY